MSSSSIIEFPYRANTLSFNLGCFVSLRWLFRIHWLFVNACIFLVSGFSWFLSRFLLRFSLFALLHRFGLFALFLGFSFLWLFNRLGLFALFLRFSFLWIFNRLSLLRFLRGKVSCSFFLMLFFLVLLFVRNGLMVDLALIYEALVLHIKRRLGHNYSLSSLPVPWLRRTQSRIRRYRRAGHGELLSRRGKSALWSFEALGNY